ncbi:MAG: hypothetical protein GC162_03730 [Planctomycetes bacterium]|nr:hypothetical protein [Planctomycetota bacterium]
MRVNYMNGMVMMALAMGAIFVFAGVLRADETKQAIVFSGGHEIGDHDYGRPVALIAAGLGVETDVFREAFSGVTPARGRGPTEAEARKNKEAMMKVLRPHGVTNERLDEVANYYRFRPDSGRIWPTREAKGYAIVEDAKVKRIVMTDLGSGYCNAPTATIKGASGTLLRVTLHYDKNLEQNGSIASVEMVTSEDAK